MTGSEMLSELPGRALDATGRSVPAVGIGCWAIGGPDTNLGLPMGWDSGADPTQALDGLQTAWELGARVFDTADIYGHGRSERLLGRLVAQVPRDQIILTSKVGYFVGTAEHGFQPGHMRRQLEQTLDNLGTDRLDVYFLHHSDFGTDDLWLDGASEAMREFYREGLIGAVGMRGPHRFALERLSTPKQDRRDKIATFRAAFDRIQPDVLAVRDNLLTPVERSAGIYAFAAQHSVGVLVNKPLAQGLLTGRHDPLAPRSYGPGDHRSRKRWFSPAGVAKIDEGLADLRRLVGSQPDALVSLAIWACLSRYEQAVVLVGFTSAEQVRRNLTAVLRPPSEQIIEAARRVMARTQRQLDSAGEVFSDEMPAGTESQ